MKNSAFIDTDIVIKIGNYEGEDLLKKILGSYDYDLYIHEYIIKEELLSSENAKRQINEMIEEETLRVFLESSLNLDEKIGYSLTKDLLSKDSDKKLDDKPRKNLGEILSMSAAYVKGYSCFISDDKEAKMFAKDYLIYDSGDSIKVINMKDIVKYVSDNESMGIKRKTMKHLYISLGLGCEDRIKKLKLEFEQIWPAKIFNA
ncbi:MAG: hypothetical protein N4A47_04500 [Clostridia bacterium]|nr:hypothetical protein [Clostridia bacterium]